MADAGACAPASDRRERECRAACWRRSCDKQRLHTSARGGSEYAGPDESAIYACEKRYGEPRDGEQLKHPEEFDLRSGQDGQT
jgi:hypothetical protein